MSSSQCLFEFPDLLLEPFNIGYEVADMSRHPVARLILPRRFDPNPVIGLELFGLDFRLRVSFHFPVLMVVFTSPNKSPDRMRVVAFSSAFAGVCRLVAHRSAHALPRRGALRPGWRPESLTRPTPRHKDSFPPKPP